MGLLIQVPISIILIFGASFASTVSRNESQILLQKVLESPRIFEEDFNTTIECVRRYLIKGDRHAGIPPMDPLRFNETHHLNIDNKWLWTNLKLWAIIIEGLMSFKTETLNLSNVMKLDVDYHFKKIHFATPYRGQANLLSMVTFNGEGTLDITLNDVHVKTSTQYNMEPPLIDDFKMLISIRKVKIRITGMFFEPFDTVYDIVYSQIATILVNEFQTEISEKISPIVKEFYNAQVGHMSFLEFLSKITELECPV